MEGAEEDALRSPLPPINGVHGINKPYHLGSFTVTRDDKNKFIVTPIYPYFIKVFRPSSPARDDKMHSVYFIVTTVTDRHAFM